MERESFDRLTRLIGTARTRRDTLRLVATAGLLGGAATLESAAAKHRRKRRAPKAQAKTQAAGFNACDQLVVDCSNRRIGPGVDLSHCDFVAHDLFAVNLRGANVSGSNFAGSTLFNEPNFRGANLSKVCFFNTDLAFSDLRGTNVSDANFIEANVCGVDFRGSNVTAEQLADVSCINCGTILPNGKRAVPCDKGQTCCNVCTDTDTDPSNCGACGNICNPGTCVNGECVVTG
jgi:uncharacterized protein YjbI with pentapeptide repeats